ncbi:hypothetical protein FRX31_013760 [Thalictrum thalictroides]|uniref:Uncharacterized protein n=1 Tax=Thalictrum thalictroides TaxID=46969 RepID=A0A7J6WJK4_THATH|nr:hypothetical protein FRX31_013760 [Thalictrum thalictroides]
MKQRSFSLTLLDTGLQITEIDQQGNSKAMDNGTSRNHIKTNIGMRHHWIVNEDFISTARLAEF